MSDKPLTPEEFAAKMREIFKPDQYGWFDAEKAHGEADDVLVELLKALGYSEGIEVYEQAEKWYA